MGNDENIKNSNVWSSASPKITTYMQKLHNYFIKFGLFLNMI